MKLNVSKAWCQRMASREGGSISAGRPAKYSHCLLNQAIDRLGIDRGQLADLASQAVTSARRVWASVRQGVDVVAGVGLLVAEIVGFAAMVVAAGVWEHVWTRRTA